MRLQDQFKMPTSLGMLLALDFLTVGFGTYISGVLLDLVMFDRFNAGLVMLDTMLFFVPLFPVYIFGMRCIKSMLWTAYATAILGGLFTALELSNAASSSLTLRQNGIDLYIDGDVTALGFVQLLLIPPFVFSYALFVVLWLRKNRH